MDLLQNPFHILMASPRDNRRRITELADERGLMSDPDECQRSRSILTNPRNRLSAEIAWLPGVGPRRANEIMALLESSPSDLVDIDNLTELARANLLAAGLSRLEDCAWYTIADWISWLAWAYEGVEPERLYLILNEDRIAAGFPEIADMAAVENAIQKQRQYYRKVIKSTLDELPSQDLVRIVTLIAESDTNYGESQASTLISDLIDLYEVETQEFFHKEEENISLLITRIREVSESNHADSTVDRLANILVEVVKNWDYVAQPIQVIRKSRGQDHDPSRKLAFSIRELAVDLFNNRDMLPLSQKLINLIQDVFAEVDIVAEGVADDVKQLDEIARQRELELKRIEIEEARYRSEISYEARIGTFFKSAFRIAPEGIEWQGQRWDLDSITRVRWGGIKHYVNGVPGLTSYKILIGNNTRYVWIDLDSKEIFDNIVDRLWRAVGINLLLNMLDGMRVGKQYQFGFVFFSDYGIQVQHRKLLSLSAQWLFINWKQIEVWNESGRFFIQQKVGQKRKMIFSYLDMDNVHVLEAAIRLLLKQDGERLSLCLKGRV